MIKLVLTYGATHGLHGLLARKVFGEAEVNHFDARRVALGRQHKVLGLDVPMANVLRVQVYQG